MALYIRRLIYDTKRLFDSILSCLFVARNPVMQRVY